jgi:TrpR family transcriptional regulator, trp operon repressor
MNQQYKKELLHILSLAAKNEKVLEALLHDLLTPEEYRELTNRWQIVKRLWRGQAQREISRDLKVGLTTVTRGVHALENSEGGFNQLLEKVGAR